MPQLVPSLRHGPQFRNALDHCIEKFAIIDRIEEMVAYPTFIAEWYGDQLPALHELARFVRSPWHNVPTTQRTPPPMVNVAWAILDYSDPDEELQTAFKALGDYEIGSIGQVDELQDFYIHMQMLLAERLKLLDYAAVLNFQETIGSLLVGSKLGHDESSMLKLAQVDKTIIYAEWFKRYTVQKQFQADWGFFQRLGEALGKPILTGSTQWHKEAVIAGYFWDEYFSKPEWPWTRIFKLFKEKGIVVKQDNLRAFKARLNRAGLKKPLYNKK